MRLDAGDQACETAFGSRTLLRLKRTKKSTTCSSKACGSPAEVTPQESAGLRALLPSFAQARVSFAPHAAEVRRPGGAGGVVQGGPLGLEIDRSTPGNA